MVSIIHYHVLQSDLYLVSNNTPTSHYGKSPHVMYCAKDILEMVCVYFPLREYFSRKQAAVIVIYIERRDVNCPRT